MALRSNGTTNKVVYANHLTALDGAQKMTLSFWCIPENGGDNFGHWVAQQGAATGVGNTHGFAVLKDLGDDTRLFLAFRNNSSAEISTSTTGVLSRTEWNHVYIVYDGTQALSDNRLKLYVNGSVKTLTQNGGTTPTSLGTTDDPFRLLQDGQQELSITGSLAEVAVWNDAIPPLGTSAMNDLLNTLRRGVSPMWYPHNLLCYMPLIRDGSDRTQRLGAVTTGSFSIVSHPPMLYQTTANPTSLNDMRQYARPDADVSDGGWTPSIGTDLFTPIDEQNANDTDYIRSGANPANDTARLRLSDISAPGTGDAKIVVRHRLASS